MTEDTKVVHIWDTQNASVDTPQHRGLTINDLIERMGFMVNCTNYGEVIVLMVVDRGGDRDFEDFGPVNDGWVEGESCIKANSVEIDIFPAGVGRTFEEALQKLRDKLALIPKEHESEYLNFLIEMRDARREAYAVLHQHLDDRFNPAPAVQKLVDDFKREFLGG